MEEVPAPPQKLGDEPKGGVIRVRHQCPSCHHIEEGFPQKHITWDKSDPLAESGTKPAKHGDT
jgi:hypothetical protein